MGKFLEGLFYVSCFEIKYLLFWIKVHTFDSTCINDFINFPPLVCCAVWEVLKREGKF